MTDCRLVLGTAGLTSAYGLGSDEGLVPSSSRESSALLLCAAVDGGIVAFDTAPAYGDAERRLGEVLEGSKEIWTKVASSASDVAMKSVRASIAATRRDPLDLVQWHNWDAGIGDSAAFRSVWGRLRDSGIARRLGATTYGAAAAEAAVSSGLFDCVQIEWNLLNQAALRAVIATPRPAGVEVALRSVFLKGVLADDTRPLPPRLARLGEARRRANETAARHGIIRRELALRTALSQPGVDYVVLGAQSVTELEELLSMAARGPLDSAVVEEAETLDIGDSAEVDPRTWH